MSLTTQSPVDVRFLVHKLDVAARRIISEAADLAYRRRHAVLDIEHVLIALFSSENELLVSLQRKGFDPKAACAQLERCLMVFETVDDNAPPAFARRLTEVLREAWLSVSLDPSQASEITISDTLGAILANDALYRDLSDGASALAPLRRAMLQASREAVFVEGAANGTSPASALSRFTIDLTARAASGETDPVIGREDEVAQVIEVLLRRRQNNPILVGEAGVGKTAVVECLAQRIAAKSVPDALKNVRLCSLDLGLLRAGASMRGELESRIKAVISEVVSSPTPIVLFIDEAHTIVANASSGGEQSDIANMIKPELARGTLRTIAATTWGEYKRYFEKDAALTRRFQMVRVSEPSDSETEDILQGLLPALQKHHGVRVLQASLGTAVRLSNRYLQGRQQPDKSISLLDTACARAVAILSAPENQKVTLTQRMDLLQSRLNAMEEESSWNEGNSGLIQATRSEIEEVRKALSGLPETSSAETPEGQSAPQQILVTSEDVAAVIADWTGVPSQNMLQSQYSVAMELETRLAERVVGQQSGIRLISERVRTFVTKLGDTVKPLGVFLLAGPSGVGKTETAHALAEAFFGDESITCINMSEYQEAHTVSKLKGAPVGYVGYGQGGILTEAIRRKPYGVLLLDEVERAHPDVLDLFLQIFDKGFLEDSEGVTIDFRNTLIVLTSNVASELIETFGNPAERSEGEHRQLHDQLIKEMQTVFAPAFIGRVHVIPYFSLNEENLLRIVNMKMAAVAQRFESAYRHKLHYGDEVVNMLVRHCASKSLGVRWIEQYISINVLSRLSEHLLDQLASGKPITDLWLVIRNDVVEIAELPEPEVSESSDMEVSELCDHEPATS